ncbi:MAG: ankyrin repeat domain-containing protein [Lentisphaeria bacterium]|nr:ankyrin repeat domain-containing protein [Lentisphaeria bacterium]
MLKAFFSACILFTASVLFAASPQPTPQDKFDKLAKNKTFGEAEMQELRSIMAAEKESGDKIDCTFCPDTFTWYLATNGFFDEAIWLFDRNADYGIKHPDGMTLLHAVCREGKKEFAEELIKRGAEINLPDNEGRIAIHYAAMSGNEHLVKSLLDLGADPNKLTKKKETPLHFAAKYSGVEEVKFLVEHGASIKAINWALVENLKDQRRRQDKLYYDSDAEHIISLKKALGLKTPESLEEDEEEEEEEEVDDGGERYADAMANNGSSASGSRNTETENLDLDNIPNDLLPRDVNDAANTDGMTALHFAAQNGDIAILQYLVDHGADIKAQDTIHSRAVLHFAAENGNLECVKYLAEHGADLLDKDAYGATALHYAAGKNHLDVIKYLVSKKMDYTAKDARGWTAMHYAARGESIDVIKYLLAKGLNINELTESGRTPLFFARGKHELRKFMLSNGAK